MHFHKNLLVLVVSLFGTSIYGQYSSGVSTPDRSNPKFADFTDHSYRLSTTISAKDLSKHLTILASDEFEGRETGYPGNDKASEYISDFFDHLDLPKIGDNNSYYQNVAFTFSSWQGLAIQHGDKKYRHLRDFVGFPQLCRSMDHIAVSDITFAGYGIQSDSYNDYESETTSKVVMIYDSEPTNSDGLSLITKSQQKSEWSVDWHKKAKIAAENGAEILLIISNDLKSIVNANRRLMVNRIVQLGDHTEVDNAEANVFFLSPKMAEEILGDAKNAVIKMRNNQIAGYSSMKPMQVQTDLTFTGTAKRDLLAGKNVLGFIEGEEKKDEIVVVSAHYDHVGIKGAEVYNGADDNGSGTSTVLEIAETLATAKRMGKGPQRSVLCLLLTGEEKGLLGSEYYANNPVFSLSNTVVNVNIDMVGRRGEHYLDTPEDYIYVIGSDRLSKDLHDINEAVNQKFSHITMDYKYNDANDRNRFYFRSDHYNFARNGIPAIFFFNGVHADYHKTSDTIEKIDFDLQAKRTKHIFHLTWDLANRKNRIRLNGVDSAGGETAP